MLKSMTDVAFDLLNKKKKEISFAKLWEEVSQVMGYTTSQAENKIATFYTEMMLDKKRFASLPDNMWDLRGRHKFEEVHIKLDSLVLEDDDDEDMIDFDKEDEVIVDDSNEETY